MALYGRVFVRVSFPVLDVPGSCSLFGSRKGLNAQQTAFAVKKYKSHRKVGLPADMIALIPS
jgi:hypothetical protein